MGKRGRNPDITDADLLIEILQHPDFAVTTSDILPRTEYSRKNLNNRLNDLAEDGYIYKKEVGASAAVYWLTDKGRQLVRDSDSTQ